MNPASAVSSAFHDGQLDLRARRGAPHVGWGSLPESVFVEELAKDGRSAKYHRVATTLLATMDRARDADALWRYGIELYRAAPWTYDLDEVVRRPLTELADALRSARVSQRHLPDSAAWRRIAEGIALENRTDAIRRLIEDGDGNAPEILEVLRSSTPGGSSRFPFLGGPKVGPMWIRMMAHPGGATISGLDSVEVAVDVQVRRVTENLGVTRTAGMHLDDARPLIQRAWRDLVGDGEVKAPGSLRDTCAGLDPALWFFAKWGCTHCVDRGYRVPVHDVCAACLLPDAPPGGSGAPLRTAQAKPLIGLVGCVKTKRPNGAPAKDLYTSSVFRDRRAEVEERADDWFILSAEHGLLAPDQWVEPYDRSLEHMPRAFLRTWSGNVVDALRDRLGDLGRYDFEIHAGRPYYAYGVADGLKKAGAKVTIPTEGLTQGRMRQYYVRRRGGAAPGVPQVANHTSTATQAAEHGRYGPLIAHFRASQSDEVQLSYEEIEAILGFKLPLSARAYAAFWRGDSRPWIRAGWQPTVRLAARKVMFRRKAS